MTSTPNTLQRTRSQWLTQMKRLGIQPARSMGQNFLVEPSVVKELVDAAGIDRGDRVVEVGPGLGILTRELLGRGATVLAVELDRELAAFLRQDLSAASEFDIVERDARYVDVSGFGNGEPFHLVANLPYSTGTVILRHFLDMDPGPSTLTVMVQKEVADRMVAGIPDISLLTLAVQLKATASVVLEVRPSVFTPPPKVDSAVVHLVRRSEPLAAPDDEARIFQWATACFQRKRKTVANGLSQGLGMSKQEVEHMLERAGIDPGLRPQAIPVRQWVDLARVSA
jgi:16S rRNA (adenine1518-N6/adenine1519-N6)-dimethyltransferase